MLLELAATPPSAPEEVSFWLSSTFWTAAVRVAETTAAGIFAPLVQANATRRAQKQRIREDQRLQLVGEIIDYFGNSALLHRKKNRKAFDETRKQIRRASEQLNLVIDPSEEEIVHMVELGMVFLGLGDDRLDTNWNALSRAILIKRLPDWEHGQLNARAPLSHLSMQRKTFAAS